MQDNIPRAKLADELGFHSIWTAEAYGTDAVSPLVWIGAHTTKVKLGTAIMQMSGRTPATTAMTAATIDALSGGRFICGIGSSGPQVVEGWHGDLFGKPLQRTREYVSILRKIWARREPLVHDGANYQIPVRDGSGKPLKLILHARGDIPIYLAAIGPRNVALAGEIADGVIASFFSPYRSDVYLSPLRDGQAKRSRPARDFQVVAGCPVVLTDDVRQGLDRVKQRLALYVGGMGAPGRNFYFDLAVRYGYEKAAAQIQSLYLSKRRDEAIAAVPDDFADETSLVGPANRIEERLQAWESSGVTLLLTDTRDETAIRTIATKASSL